VQHRGGRLKVGESVARMVESEREQRLDDLQTYRDFAARVEQSRRDLLAFLNDAKAKGKTVAALGASTKGNVVLQYCGVDESLIFAVGEINPDKFGAYTPGSDIPIANEADVIRSKPDFVLVLPWHFRRFFETQPRYAGLKLVYPLPVLSVP
jgi:NDP-4-keto-2,6-dideoxyhexose 3-C-methyltransferase